MNKKARILLVLCTALIAAIILFRYTKAASSEERTGLEKPGKYYISYEVKPGDSLWTLSSERCLNGDITRAEYIEEVKTINHLDTDQISAGSSLILVVYR